MVSVNEFAPWAGVAVMLLVSYWGHRRDAGREERAAAGLEAADKVRIAKVDALEIVQNQHLLECAEAHTRHTMAIENLTVTVERLERAVNQVQAQIRNVATDSSDTVFKRERR